MTAVWASVTLSVHLAFSFPLPGEGVFAVFRVCFHACLFCFPGSVSAVSWLGQQVLMSCTTDHTTQQLLTHRCVCKHDH